MKDVASNFEVILGPNNLNTLSAMSNLAGLYKEQGKVELAEPLYKNCLEEFETILGNDHPNTLVSMDKFAGLYYCQGKYDLAEPLMKDCTRT